MEEIRLRDLGEYILSKILYVIAIMLSVCCVGVFYLTVLQPPRYESSTSLIMTGFSNVDKNNEATISTNDLSINQKLLPTYQEITKSKKVLEQVIRYLNLDYSIDELAKHISVTAVTDTEIIKITVYDENAEKAYQIVERIADVFSEEVKSIYNVSNVSILDTPNMATSSSNMRFSKALMLSLGMGAIVSFAFIFVLYYFDTTVKNASQIESKIDVPVLGSIPDYNNKSKRKKGRK